MTHVDGVATAMRSCPTEPIVNAKAANRSTILETEKPENTGYEPVLRALDGAVEKDGDLAKTAITPSVARDAIADEDESVLVPALAPEPAKKKGKGKGKKSSRPEWEIFERVAEAEAIVEGKDYLEQTYGRRSRQLLTDEELAEFIVYLESLPTSLPTQTEPVEATEFD